MIVICSSTRQIGLILIESVMKWLLHNVQDFICQIVSFFCDTCADLMRRL